ncbi:MAG TPA: DUF4424 domain-containing protein [Xanthobacteraceae bacterium]|nr:DUF4424 domain-containing protein [Xanthobacteraceae bacterium]
MRRAIALAIVLTCLAPAGLAPVARANDTTAELATGGLIFVTTDAVEMRSEKLFISTKQVRVTYAFFNKSDQDVTTLVAFPLPEIRIANQDDNVAVPSVAPDNVFGFKTTVDGVPVKAEVEQRVTAMGVDRTQYLRTLGIPLDPHLPATNAALDKLPADKWPELIALGLAEVIAYDDTGKGMQKHLEARWGLATTYYWKQTFPAKKQIVIQHQYVPSVGGSAQTALGAPAQATIPGYADYAKKYCIDQAFMATIQSLRKANKSEFGPPMAEQRIDYILKTGANWSGPIGDFELTVDKGSPDALVSFCGKNVKKISATQFQMQQKDFSPEGDLAVLILIKNRN